MKFLEKCSYNDWIVSVKGELALKRIPITEENIQNFLDDRYAVWLANDLNTIIHKNDGINDFEGFYNLLKTIPSKYYCIVEQWLYKEPIHYEGKYFTFEEIYNKVKIVDFQLGIVDELYKIKKCTYCFEQCEKMMNDYKNLLQKDIKEFKESLECQMSRILYN